MTSNTFIKIKQPTKPTHQPQSPPQAAISEEVEPTQPLEIEQMETIVESELVAEIRPDESVFGCGWSVTELRNEFSGRQ